MALSEEIRKRAEAWLSEDFNEETRKEVKRLLANDEKEVIDAFYKDLEFGTGGLRGVMGVGTNRMNIYTVGMATQGLANYIKKQCGDKDIRIAIAHDCRNNSRLFAETTANIFSANGFEVLLFESLRPTPELSFATRYYKCTSGVVVTASHNPPEYNGYKVYWSDGGQIVAPHDKGIIEEVRKIKSIKEIRFDAQKDKIKIIGEETDNAFLEEALKLSINPDVIKKYNDLKIVYTPVHGTGIKLIPPALKRLGFKNVYNVPEQDISDGNFPTVKSPNPEEPATLKMAIDKAIEKDADIVMASDPDADRLGIAVKDLNGQFVLLNGNQTGVLLCWYILSQFKACNLYTGKEYLIKTIVTTDLIDKMAASYGIDCFNVLTGFKYFGDLIGKLEGKRKFIGGGEESYGYLTGEYVRDKDAVSACIMISEAAAWAKSQGITLYELLINLYNEYGLYKERLVNVVRKGKEGAAEIQNMMTEYRNNPPKEINNSKVIMIKDYSSSESLDCVTGAKTAIDLPKSNVLQFFLEDGSKISIRPSGTEPKIKFYISVNTELKDKKDFELVQSQMENRIDKIIESLGV